MQGGKINWMGIAAVVITVCMAGSAMVLVESGELEKVQGIAFAENTATAEQLTSPFKAVYEKISPSVVGIKVASGNTSFGGRIVTTTSYAGSGVVISEDGYVLTNYHVVEGATGVYVVSGDKTFEAEYVAGDASSDVAVLRVIGAGLPAAALGDSDALSVGDWALVVGNPLGEQLANTLTVGVISGLGRDLSTAGATVGTTNLIQTNAAINSGNSGGGLFNVKGELVGITSMKLSNNGYSGYASIEGIGFSIPINSIKTIVNDLIVYGRVQYPRIGISMEEISTPSMTPTSDLLPCSVWITEVESGSPAEVAGIRVDDLIVEVDGVRVTTSREVQSAVRAHAIGEAVSITVYRIPGLSQIRVNEAIPEGEYLTFDVSVELLDVP